MAIVVAHDDEGFGQLISKIIKLPQGQCLSGGMYTEQIVTALCSVTLTAHAVACNWVINGMGLFCVYLHCVTLTCDGNGQLPQFPQ